MFSKWLPIIVVCLISSAAYAAPVLWNGDGHYYELISPSGGIDWSDAKAAAASMSYMGQTGHLATITSAAEEQFVESTFTNTFTWIGLTDEVTEGSFKWVTGEPFVYSDWLPGEPNNSATDPPGEDYVQIDYSRVGRGQGIGWNDYQDRSTILGGPGISYLVEYNTVPETTSPALAGGGVALALLFARRRTQLQ